MPATIIPDFKNVTLATAGDDEWTGYKLLGTGGTGISHVFDSGVFIQGADAAAIPLSNKQGWLFYDWAAAPLFDAAFDFLGVDAGKLVWIWCNVPTAGLMKIRAEGGISIILSAGSTTNFSEWFVDGSDTYAGGWKRYVLDPRKPPSRVGGAGADLSAITYLGMAGDIRPNSSKADAVVVDRIDVGNGLRVFDTSSDPDPTADGFGYWQDILNADEGTPDNKYGIVRSDNDIIYVQGAIELGDTKGNRPAALDERNRIIVWENPTYYSDLAPLVAGVYSTLPIDASKLVITGSAGAEGYFPTTSINHGVKVGDGDSAVGAAGILIQSAGPAVSLFVSGGSGGLQADTLNWYGCTFLGLDGLIHPVEDSSHEMIGCVIDQCNTVSAGAAIQRANTYSGVSVSASRGLQPFSYNTAGNGRLLATPGLSAALIYEDGKTDIKNSAFLANSYGGISLPVHDGGYDGSGQIFADGHGIHHRVLGDQTNITYDNLTFSGNDKDILYSGWETLIIEATNGADPTSWAKTSGGFVDIQLSATLTLSGIVASGHPAIQDNFEGSEVRIYETGTINELTGIENVHVNDGADRQDFEFTYNASTVPNIDIVIHHIEFEYYRIDNFEPSITSASLPIDQQYDRNYSNPS